MSRQAESRQVQPKASELRLLIVAPTTSREDGSTRSLDLYDHTNSLFQQFLTHLTGVSPPQDLTSFAGYTSHEPYTIRNKYYSTTITLWCDELPCQYLPVESTTSSDDGDATLKEWRDNMLSDEAKEVRDALGGLVLLLPWSGSRLSQLKKQEEASKNYGRYLSCMNDVRDKIEDESGREIATLVVLQDVSNTDPQRGNDDLSLKSFTERLEDVAMTEHDIYGWEAISWHPHANAEAAQQSTAIEQSDPTMTAAYSEKTGMPRIKEVLEQVNWTVSISGNLDMAGHIQELAEREADLQDNSYNGDFQTKDTPAKFRNEVELQREMAELHFALEDQQKQETNAKEDSGDDLQIEQLTALMSRAAEIKAAGAEMSKEDRAKFAKREISRLMNELEIK